MANVTGKQITLDGPRNAVVKLTGVIDTADVSLTPAVALADFTNNERDRTLSGFRIDIIEFSASDPLELKLEWNAATPQQITPLAGRGRINAWNYGGLLPDMGAAGFTGGINLKTKGFSAGEVAYTVILEMVKLYK